MRLIVRFSLNDDSGTKLRNKLGTILARYGVTRGGNTATLEAPNISKADLSAAMIEIWTEIDTNNGPGNLDHFWMYVDA